MANGTDRRSRHFIIEGFAETQAYRSPQQGGSRTVVPERDRARHSRALQRQVEALRPQADAARDAQQAAGMDELGLHVEFESFADIELAFESLARERSGIELLNVRQDGDRTLATVFVPDGKLDHFERLIRDYLAERRDSIGRARDNRKLVDAIRQIRAASLRALWTDADTEFPTEDEGSLWWEVWLPVRRDRQAVVASFRERAEAQRMRVAPGDLVFPERTVLLVSASLEQMRHSMLTLNSIAELGEPRRQPSSLTPCRRQSSRTGSTSCLRGPNSPPSTDDVPRVCLLDTGVNRGHPFLHLSSSRTRRGAGSVRGTDTSPMVFVSTSSDLMSRSTIFAAGSTRQHGTRRKGPMAGMAAMPSG